MVFLNFLNYLINLKRIKIKVLFHFDSIEILHMTYQDIITQSFLSKTIFIFSLLYHRLKKTTSRYTSFLIFTGESNAEY